VNNDGKADVKVVVKEVADGKASVSVTNQMV
jgi:hypothetical protein